MKRLLCLVLATAWLSGCAVAFVPLREDRQVNLHLESTKRSAQPTTTVVQATTPNNDNPNAPVVVTTPSDNGSSSTVVVTPSQPDRALTPDKSMICDVFKAPQRPAIPTTPAFDEEDRTNRDKLDAKMVVFINSLRDYIAKIIRQDDDALQNYVKSCQSNNKP